MLAGTLMSLIGTSWDVQWHVDVGPDTFFTLPHLVLYSGSAIAGIASLAGWANMTLDKDADGRIERVFKQGDRSVREDYRKDGSHAELVVLLPNGIVVEAKGEQVGIDLLRNALRSVDLDKLAATARPPG